MKKKHLVTDCLLLTVLTLIFYWPVSFCIFSLKNDSLIQYLPYRYHLSEAVQNGYFPFWSPYLYTGFPIHADMQGMTWNPIVLLLSVLTKYNMSVLQIEVSIYLILSSIGMYVLLKSFNFLRTACIIGSVSYMSCGFIVDSASVIPWISSAAFIPFVFASFYKLLLKPGFSKSIIFSLWLSLFFVSCYPSLFIFTFYLLAFIILAFFIHSYREKRIFEIKKIVPSLIVGTISFMLLCAPAILSYVDFLPYYSRGKSLTAAFSISNSFPPFSAISYLLPNAVSQPHPWINTDRSMRNAYIGILLLAFFFQAITRKLPLKYVLIISLTIFSFLFSLGPVTPVHEICFKFFPLMDTFRHPGNMRLFTSIGIVILSVYSLNNFLIDKKPNRLKAILYILIGLLLVSLIYVALTKNIQNNLASVFKSGSLKEKLDRVSFHTIFFFEGIVQIGFIFLLLYFLSKKTTKTADTGITFLFITNSLIFCWVGLPFTFISQIKTKTVDGFLAAAPKAYPKERLRGAIHSNTYFSQSEIAEYGYKKFYDKQITLHDRIINPTINKDYNNFLSRPSLRKYFDHYPIAYIADTVISAVNKTPYPEKMVLLDDPIDLNKSTKVAGTSSIQLTGIGPNHLSFQVQTSTECIFSLFQQFNHNWKAEINGKETRIYKSNIAFMAVKLKQGSNKVKFLYAPKMVTKAIIVSLLTLIFLCGALVFARYRKRKSEAMNVL